MRRFLFLLSAVVLFSPTLQADHVRDLQTQAVESKRGAFGNWGWDRDNYLAWASHSNRLIPVYTFGTAQAGPGISLTSYQGSNSPYASEEKLKALYGYVPYGTQNATAPYFDQTNIFDIQKAALAAGKKHIILVVFDGTDWQTTFAASTYKNGRVVYTSGRGSGLHLQDYKAGGTTEFGWMVTSPWCDEAKCDVNKQTVSPVEDTLRGGYAYEIAGLYPWSQCPDLKYLIGKSEVAHLKQAYTDSSTSAASMTSGIKSYNASINVRIDGTHSDTIASLAQKNGYKIGVVTSVPISHATPGAAYAHNVHRNDFQDITRDLLGLPSVSHPDHPLQGVDVLMGCGYGVERPKDQGQGANFIPGNPYLTLQDQQKSDVRSGGKYVIAQRTAGVKGVEELRSKAEEAMAGKHRLLGYFGTTYGHLPFQTADGQFDPTMGRTKKAETYTPQDLEENPHLAQMVETALDVLNHDSSPFWLMLEAGDVDWANHDNNIDNSIGALLSGDAAVKAVTDWVEKNSSWDETVMIVTADHGHYLNLDHPELLVPDQK